VTAALIQLETEDLAAASRSLYTDVADPCTSAASQLISRLQECGGMAGDDPAGRDWATAYDRAAAATLSAAENAINACYRVSSMFAQTARNYEAADSASTAGVRQAIAAATSALPDECAIGLPTDLASAAGGSGGRPTGWGLIDDAVGYVWPNGHQDRLHRAASAWRSCGDSLWSLSEYAAVAAVPAMGHHLPEFDDMTTVCNGLYMHLREVAHAQFALADACDELAHHLDVVHSAVEHELVSLIEWSAAIQATGFVASVFSFGTAEAPTQAVEAGRIAKTAARVGHLIEKFTAMARTVAQSIGAVAERAEAVAARLRLVLNAKVTAAAVTVAGRLRTVRATGELGALGRLSAAGEFPEFSASIGQLENKFKHARDFGVLQPRGRRGFDAYEQAVSKFIADPKTVRIHGTYRGDRVILSYNAKSALVVVQKPDGGFIAGWQMSQKQLRYVLRRGSLGGD
jgi:Colicin D